MPSYEIDPGLSAPVVYAKPEVDPFDHAALVLSTDPDKIAAANYLLGIRLTRGQEPLFDRDGDE